MDRRTQIQQMEQFMNGTAKRGLGFQRLDCNDQLYIHHIIVIDMNMKWFKLSLRSIINMQGHGMQAVDQLISG